MRRRTLFASNSLGNSEGDTGGHLLERKGLFENDDDATDSLETFHERVKLRQTRKQSEMKALKAQLETVQLHAEELETQLTSVTKEKEEAVIRTNECQRIVEKRNKQLMKASERIARHSEQYELQVAEMQARLTAFTAQCDQLRADAATTEELGRHEHEVKEQELKHEFEAQNKRHEKLLQGMESRSREQLTENAVLVKKLGEMEQQLAATMHQKPSSAQVMASDEYQSLLKRSEDADAISRGLKFQLEKEQQEKKYLRKQLTALQATVGPTAAAATAATVGFLPDPSSSETREDIASPTNMLTQTQAARTNLSSRVMMMMMTTTMKYAKLSEGLTINHESKTSESEAEEERSPVFRAPSAETPPLPPEPTVADTELYIRQQARLRERHELQMKKKLEADEADLVRGDIHRRVEMWAFGKELLHMILTLDQISSNEALKKCQLMVVQSPEDDTVRKAYRNIIRVVHPDKLRGATVSEQLEAKELFTVLNQAFDRFKSQSS
ncbi:hypothetical protein BBO99_00009395 [Phytophthora kernoviae]|uniref:J domain-containing protein n=2 Tax=Phytophthora kernoviae TaxID=325452 RepID=A0A421EU62_9STRA|nr:hypothetical protein G195_010684 [Phytophthora kernoviae 00238/432]KAG2505149.1 hypothetical protein JM16_008986 [Phytophthora kernoviae]KAG2507302.1 hypothetical protein JM18_009023 [Phytophthora kernoviae]RLN02283.1 hypothetical protein BBI17_009416 [Phytophthora kernoviae]RLN73514.1 hypothetical protein BBO99_00009395 [Phytophthora kernoviae]